NAAVQTGPHAYETDDEAPMHLPQGYSWQRDLVEEMAAWAESDFDLFTVDSVGEGTITVAGVDWSWMPEGHPIGIGSGTYSLAAQATEEGGGTVLSIEEDLGGVEAGASVWPVPLWDGTYADASHLAALWTTWK